MQHQILYKFNNQEGYNRLNLRDSHLIWLLIYLNCMVVYTDNIMKLGSSKLAVCICNKPLHMSWTLLQVKVLYTLNWHAYDHETSKA